MYKLKDNQEKFTMTDGAYSGKSYAPGKLYAEIPPSEARRFDDLSLFAAPPKTTITPSAAVTADTINQKTETARKNKKKRALFPIEKEE